ncbi:hypothetical protein FA13DRAFT_1785999 [Coprinellus micaceus]|uniref:Uncharacterized protein n=1 Tax=Coprinellus micaceus TaxID=71717 RepID=A0A4Y7TVH8_COPMI|nr:hypothetical protein FA13DRAFT_1785999 [Coprinellus micaceus]
MSSGSPTAYLLWSVLSCIFLVLLILHLWLYDKFACLKWDSGRQPGAFKRVMTYSYLGTLPTLIIFSVVMTVLKYREGWVVLPGGHILPRPFDSWNPDNRKWLLPLFLVLSFSWSLELVTHLEELAFWLFLLHQGPGKRDWFHCWEFRAWYLGSCAAVLGMPLTVLVTRHQLDTTLAYIFLVGSTAGITTTVCFLYVIFRFPAFLDYVKAGGADPDVIVRLATFYELNCIRVVFRFIFSVPLLIIGVDALGGPYPVVGSPFALDFLLMVAGIGSFISSGITLLIFFPRSITQESGYRAKVMTPDTSAKPPSIVGGGPEYFHDHNQSHYYPDPSNPISVLESPVTPGSGGFRMRSFRFPHDADGAAEHNIHAPQRRDSADTGDLSMEYESEGEVLPMSTKANPQRHPVQHSQSQPGHKRIDSFTDSGTKSSGTICVPGGSMDPTPDGRPSGSTPPATLRRHNSDSGPFFYNRHGRITRFANEPSVDDHPSRTSSPGTG